MYTAPGRIGRRGIYYGFSARGYGFFELFGGDFVVGFDARWHYHRRAFRQFYYLHVAYPVRSRHEYFVTLVHQYLHYVVNRVLGACGNDYLVRLVVQIVVAFEFVADGFFKFRVTCYRRIETVIVVDGFLAASFTASGVKKSVSPSERLITSTPGL